MKRDTIFYTFFQRSPTAVFDLLPDPPENAADYRFDAVSVKEAKFEIDGVFLPPEGKPGTIYFCEVQMQKIDDLYERLFAEAFLYFRQNRPRFSDWQFVVIYPSRSTEQDDVHPFRAVLSSDQMHIIYLDELGDVEHLPLWISLMVLTTVKEQDAVDDAKVIIERARREKSSEESRVIIELAATIILYKFEKLSTTEVQSMLDIPIRESRLFTEGRKEGLLEGQVRLVIRLLTKRFGEISEDVTASINQLSAADVESLGEAVLDFSDMTGLQDWLKAHRS